MWRLQCCPPEWVAVVSAGWRVAGHVCQSGKLRRSLAKAALTCVWRLCGLCPRPRSPTSRSRTPLANASADDIVSALLSRASGKPGASTSTWPATPAASAPSPVATTRSGRHKQRRSVGGRDRTNSGDRGSDARGAKSGHQATAFEAAARAALLEQERSMQVAQIEHLSRQVAILSKDNARLRADLVSFDHHCIGSIV